MPDYQHAPGIAQPQAPHTMTEAAEKARQAVRDFAARRNAERDAAPPLVTEHPKYWAAVDPSKLTGAAALFAKKAEAAGARVFAQAKGDRVEVRVLALESGLVVAWWLEGRTSGAVIGLNPVPLTVAEYALTMPARLALERYTRESDERKAKAAATRNAKLDAAAAS